MKLTRREFLALSAKATAGTMIFAACGLPERELIVQSPVELPEDVVRGTDAWYATTSPDLPGGDGLLVRVMEGRAKKIAGNPDHPVNRGKQSARHDAAIQLTYHPDRIREPLFRSSKGGIHDSISWARAESIFMNAVEAGNGNMSVVTNPLNGLLGTVASSFAALNGGRYITFDAVEQGTALSALQYVYGVDQMPYFDIGNAKAILSVGADWLSSWQSPVGYGVRYGEFRGGDERGYLIHAEPRMSMTAAAADLWLPVLPGQEGTLAMSIASVIINERLVGSAQIAKFLDKIQPAALYGFAPEDVENTVGVSAYKIRKAAAKLTEHGPSLAFAGGNAAAQTNGAFNLAAVYALNTLLGSIGQDGGIKWNPAGPLPVQANATKGDSFTDWELELAQWRSGEVATVILRGADIVYGMPNSTATAGAMDEVETVIGFGTVMNDTLANCDLVLPERSFLETWDASQPSPAPGYQVVTIQQPVIPETVQYSDGLLSDARGFGDMLLWASDGVLGADDMREMVDNATSDLFNERRGSVTASNVRLFRQGVMQRGGWWDIYSAHDQQSDPGPANVFDLNRTASFSDTDGLGDGDDFALIPFVNNSLINGQLSPTPFGNQTPDPMTSAAWETWVEINDHDAEALGIRQHDVLFIKSQYGEIEAVAYPTPAGRPGVISIPIGLGHQSGGRYDAGQGSNVLSILAPQVEQRSGAIAWASTKVRIARTGRRRELPKFEGEVVAFPAEPGVPILVVAPGQSAHDAEVENHHLYQSQFIDPTNSESNGADAEGGH